jgi:four helix bundle protein
MLDYGCRIIQICAKLPRTVSGRHIALQLVSSGTSVGANYEEACGAQSRADFIHKLQIVLKETRESIYWLKLASRSRMLPEAEVLDAIRDAQAIGNIVARSLVTAKSRMGAGKANR